METFLNDDAIKLVTEVTKKIIIQGDLNHAFELLDKNFSEISEKIATSILLNNAKYVTLCNKRDSGLISDSDADVEEAKIKLNLTRIITKVPGEIEIQKMLGKFKQPLYKSTSYENLEKILGPINHLVKINWLYKGILASKSVCQVVRSDGQKGTGFLLKNGYLMTNFHVLPNKDRARSAKIIFDYEEDLSGNMLKTSTFFLEPDDSKFSPIQEYDYAYIKVIDDNPANSLNQWGFLELDTFSEPQINDPVTIIQHPLGQAKQIALTANQIIGINGDKLFYLTDTEKGSSGSPVFNNEWQVIALHHAGKKEEDGGLLIDPSTAQKRGANEGILIKSIAQHIGVGI